MQGRGRYSLNIEYCVKKAQRVGVDNRTRSQWEERKESLGTAAAGAHVRRRSEG
jgi:hypothetical protein